MRHQFARAVCSCVCLLAPDGALLAQPAGQAVQPAIQVQEPDGPSDGSTDIDRTIPYPMSRVLIAAKQAVTMHRCFLKREQPDYLECVRERHRGANGAGEKVTVQLTASGSDTRVEIKTGKEFWFQIPWGQRNWSTPIFIAMMSALERPPDLAQDARIGVLAPASGPLVGTRVRVTAPGTAGEPMEKVGNVLTVDQRTLTIINEDSERVSFRHRQGKAWGQRARSSSFRHWSNLGTASEWPLMKDGWSKAASSRCRRRWYCWQTTCLLTCKKATSGLSSDAAIPCWMVRVRVSSLD